MKLSAMNRLIPRCLLVVACIGLGCHSETDPAPTGTPGILLAGTHSLKDVQITVYPDEPQGTADAQPLAFGITDDGGRFRLQSHGSLDGFDLPEGNYRMTLESVGEFQLIWPAEFSSPRQTPLKKTWSSSDSELVLDVPEPRIVL